MPAPRTVPTTPCTCPRVCLACHDDRLASLLETASAFRFFRLAPEVDVEETVWAMPPEGLATLALRLARADVRLLVCGGATCCCLAHFSQQGVAVAPWIAGDVPTVLAALRHNRLETLLAPGARPGRGLARRAEFSKIHLEFEAS